MTRLFSLFALLVASLSTSFAVQAEQFKNIGNLEVHYSSFPSTFLTPDVASTYKIQRSRYSAVINVTVLDKAQPDKPAVTAVLNGQAKNLLGTIKNLSFREVREGTAIYYIAEIKHANEERFSFSIDVSHNGTRGNIEFDQTFYVD
ncbi:DUF4426 domain-containing protein [Photobacterium gaetbulicola]|uniref:DUF4426 domain-containing protein n=1 Tax=Photobacterium gaetbulicola Gung47 TaxID=658445 RepID=A0A0C5WMC5_9GAMM|nr:DUF4426 domain-containing protein [Photobacterium gaetbulicola]AJR07492.1 hypothetical protein H744_2c0770 [Photobacterium gaetbulicola Gung47]PST99489.1 DUF4426 domain-containing protein [Photobacterium gaetbulicola]